MTGPCGRSTLQGLRGEVETGRGAADEQESQKERCPGDPGREGFQGKGVTTTSTPRRNGARDDWEHARHYAGRW